jgi:hypothetical protein
MGLSQNCPARRSVVGFSRTQGRQQQAATAVVPETGKPVNPANHVSKGSHPYVGSVESPPSALDPQNKFGASELYNPDASMPHTVWPWRTYPWMTIPAPQLGSAQAMHNIWNMVYPTIAKYPANPQTVFSLSNRMRSVLSHRIKLPNTGVSSLGGEN